MFKVPSFAMRVMAVSVSLALGACASIEPKPFTGEDLRQQATQDRSEGRQGVEPIKGAISLEEAMARALKYNLDRRVRMMEEALALRQLDVTKLDMLPKILAQAGYSNRNNDYGTRNANGLISGSQERVHTLSELGMSWNLLDLGIGYYNSLQQADRVLVAAEKRRKAMHLLMQDVRIAFWRVASAQRLEGQIRAAIKMSEEALADARKVEESRVRNPLDALRYQRQVLENLRLLEAVAQELSAAQVDLAALINAPMGTPLKIVEPNDGKSRADIMKIPVERLEESALVNNADIREQSYNARIAREEARKTLVRLFPNLGFNYTLYYDTDKFLVNDNWNRAGLQLSFNLMNLFTYDTQKKLAEGGIALADLRRVTAQAAVITQVHLSRLQLANANAQLNRAREIYSTDRRLAELVANREAAQAQSKLERVSAEAAAILSQLRYYQALSQVHAAEARLEASLGVEPVIGTVFDISLADLTKQLSAASEQTLAQKLTPATQKPPVPAKPAAKPSPVAKPAAEKPQAKAAEKPVAKPEPKKESTPAAKPETKTESKPDTKPAAKPQSKPAGQSSAIDVPLPADAQPASREALAFVPELDAAADDTTTYGIAGSSVIVQTLDAKPPVAAPRQITVTTAPVPAAREPAVTATPEAPRRAQRAIDVTPLDRAAGNYAYGGLNIAQGRAHGLPVEGQQ